MKKIFKIFVLLPLLFIMNSCEDKERPVGPDPGPDTEGLPSPPEHAISANVFLTDIFTTLQDDGYFFEKRDIASVAQHISASVAKLPLVFMFDRADFTVGTSHPMNKLSYTSNVYQLFAQQEPTSATVTKGTAIATKYPINIYDGIAQEGTYMSGLTVSAPLTTLTPICIYTTRISSFDQIGTIYDARGVKLLSDAVIIALVDNSIKAEVVDYVENTMSMRATVYGSSDTKLDVMVIVPAAYVCRSIEKGMTINLPYYRISIEKWLWQ